MWLVSLLVLSAANAPTLAMPGLNAVNISPNEAGLHAEVLAQALMKRGVQVTTARDVQTLLGVERQRQLMGCGEQSCIAELANALGADGLVLGDIGKVDGQWSVTVRIIASRDGKTLAAFARQSKENVAALLDQAAVVLVQGLNTTLHLDLRTEASPTNGFSRWWALAPGALAVGGGVVGAVFTAQAQTSLKDLKAAQFQGPALDAKNAGTQQQTIAWVGFSVAIAGVVGAATVLVLGGEPVTPVVAMDSHGASIGVAGVLP
jgi:hypothetical protein